MKYRDSYLYTGLKIAVILLAGCSRGGDGVAELNPDFIATQDPNRFLQFLNTQVGLPAGNYTIVAGTQTPGESGSFTIRVERDNGSTSTFSGDWTSSTGPQTPVVIDDDGSPGFNFAMAYSGGARITISSSIDTCLYLLDSGGSVLAGQFDVGGPSEDLCSAETVIDMPKSKINTAANGNAYYRAIDPNDTRTTLDDWKEENGFGTDCGDGTTTSCERHVIFRDTKDLGYGRDMRARKNQDGSFAVFVRNFRVNALPGLSYTTLNLDAAIANNEDPTGHDSIQWHFGSNAIEFSTYPYGSGEPRDGEIATFATNGNVAPMFTKYFTFKPDDIHDPETTERRLDTVDLDSHGFKSMPGPCISCHGGMNRPLLPDGTLPPPIPGGVPGDTQAHMQAIEVSTVTFSEVPGWTCEDIIEGIDFINQGVLSTYEIIQQQYGDTGSGQVLGYWQPDFAADLIEGWYGEYTGGRTGFSDADRGDFTIPTSESYPDYSPAEACDYLRNRFYSYVPAGWMPDSGSGTPPPGADDLFREVVAPNCMVCHSRRGTNLGPNGDPEVRQDIDFSTYERFISHAEQIERFIFQKGVMPLGSLNFDAFWDNSGPGHAELLASHLPDFDSFNSDGSVRRPGRPVAVIAAPRNTNVPVTLSAEGSSFADSYQWSIIGVAPGATLTGANTARPVFTGPNGNYTLQLIVRSGSQQSAAVTADIAVTDSYPLPANLRYETSADDDENIKFILQSNPLGAACTSCHAAAGQPGVPVYYTDAQVEGRDRYLELLQRINFKEPIESPLLRKPSGNHHFGGLIDGFDLDGNRYNYDLFLNWILQGAPR
ncbi:MAG TPA: hypothetical protein VGL10_10390 [Gammaproteobacteria bacterium]